MLTIPFDKIAIILNQASDVEPADVVAAEVAAAFEGANDERSEDALAGTPGRQALVETLEGLTTEEVYELLALAELAAFDRDTDSWNAAVQRAQAITTEDAIDRLLRSLVLSDAIEVGLDRLGYDVPEEPKTEVAKKRQKKKISTRKTKPRATNKPKVRTAPTRRRRH
jgi:Protein of unknown function (DUF3775)